METTFCPNCNELVVFSKKRQCFYCAECESEFNCRPQRSESETIFLSYAHRSESVHDFDLSEELVVLVKDELERDGHTVWIDRDRILGGSQWREQITSAIVEHSHFLSFLSKRSVRDPGVCLNEIAIALGQGKNIQTVMTEDEIYVQPPLTISHIQWHDFRDWKAVRDEGDAEHWNTWFAARMDLLRDSLTSAQNAKAMGELQVLRDLLDPRSFEASVIEKTLDFHGRQWLFDSVEYWLEQSTSPIFWLTGSPGTGKSTFAAKLMHHSRSVVIGYYSCDFQRHNSSMEAALVAVRTLAFQIASRIPDYRTKLIHQYLISSGKIQSRSPHDLFEYLIMEPLSVAGKIPEATRYCIVIDGLDEAGNNSQGNILAEVLFKFASRLPPWIGMVVTSRPEPYLLRMIPQISLVTESLDSPQNISDLEQWFSVKLPNDWSQSRREEFVDVVVEKSGANFLYLTLLTQSELVDNVNPNNLPSRLDGWFTNNFKRCFPDITAYSTKALPVLSLLVASPGPLPMSIIGKILCWSNRDIILNVVEPMGSLLVTADSGLTFFHDSIRSWLSEADNSGPYTVEPSGAYVIADFLWQDYEDAKTRSLHETSDVTSSWITMSLWNRLVFRKGYSPRFWINAVHTRAKLVAANSGDLDREIEFARRLVCLAHEAYGVTHDLFEIAKDDWQALVKLQAKSSKS